MSLSNTLRFLVNHPLNKDHRASALVRFLRWQLSSRITKLPVIAPFVNDTHLVMEKGDAGVTGNYYCGLLEFRDMAFLLHFLRPSDLFVDIGANVGSYTVLAAGAIGTKSVSFEPVPRTFQKLLRNIRYNGMSDRVEAVNKGVGREFATLKFSTAQDAENHVLPGNVNDKDALELPIVPVDSLDFGDQSLVFKIDVEGFESEVLAGASNTLRKPNVLAIIMEMNRSGDRYGHNDKELAEVVRSMGFGFYDYDPFARTLSSISTPWDTKGNVICLRDEAEAAQRCASAPKFSVLGKSI